MKIHEAVCAGNLEIVRKLCEENDLHLKLRDNKDRLPLHLAVINNRFEVVDYLSTKSNHQYVNEKDIEGRTPLQMAILGKNLDILKYFCENGANLEDRDASGRTAIIIAARTEYLKTSSLLYSYGADINAKDNDGKTALHHATERNALKLIKFLIENGANVNEKDNNGNTPAHSVLSLSYTSEQVYIKIIKYLYEKCNANLQITNNDNSTVLEIALYQKYYALVEYLMENSKTSDINHKYSDGCTLFHLAVKYDWLKIVRHLHRKGIYIHAKDDRGRTALFYVISLYTLRFLYEIGMNINEKDNKGVTLLHKAAKLCNFDMFEYLCANGANIYEKDNNGHTAFYYCLMSCERVVETRKIINYLINKSVHLHENDNDWKMFIQKTLCYTTGPYMPPLVLTNYLISVHLKTNDSGIFLPYKFYKDLIDVYLTKDDEDIKLKNLFKRNISSLNELFEWFNIANKNIYSANNPMIIHDYYDDNIICKYNVDAQHLMLASIQLPCGNMVCLKCAVKGYVEMRRYVCCIGHCYKKLVMDFNDTKLKINTIWDCNSHNIYNIGTKSLNYYIKMISILNQTKETYTAEHYQNVIGFIEDVIEVRIHSIKTCLENIEKKMLRSLSKFKTYLRKPCKSGSIEFVRNFEITLSNLKNVNKKQTSKEICLSNVGVIYIEAKFPNLNCTKDDMITERAIFIERTLYLCSLNLNASSTKSIEVLLDKVFYEEQLEMKLFFMHFKNMLFNSLFFSSNKHDFEQILNFFMTKPSGSIEQKTIKNLTDELVNCRNNLTTLETQIPELNEITSKYYELYELFSHTYLEPTIKPELIKDLVVISNIVNRENYAEMSKKFEKKTLLYFLTRFTL